MNNEKEKGIWIPIEILQDTRLDPSVKMILAVYKYYTIEGELHCCVLTNDELGKKIGMSGHTVQRAKKTLKELGLIETNGGIKTWYKGYQNDTHNNSDKNTQGVSKLAMGGIQVGQGRGIQVGTHNKERIKKEKKENKSTIEHKSNTYNISTSKEDDEDLEYMERYGIGKLSYILQHNDDWLPALEYLQKHPTKPNYDTIEAYWSGNNEYLGYLHNFNNNTLRIKV